MGGASSALAFGVLAFLLAGPACGKSSDGDSAAKEEVAAGGEATPSPDKPGDPGVEDSLAKIVATVARATGPVEVRRAGSDAWEPAAVGSVLREGDWVRTAEASTARIRFSRLGAMELEEGTSIEVQAGGGEQGDSVIVGLDTGSVAGTVDEKSDAEQPLIVRGPDGSETRLRAEPGAGRAEYRVRRGKKGMRISVRKGRLKVSRKGVDTEIAKGQAADLTADGVGEVVSQIAFPMSVSPGIDARYRFAKGMTIKLEWKRVSAAIGYRVQVAKDLAFHELVESTWVEGTSRELAPSAPGTYVWRVASIDSDGHVGEYGFARRIYSETDALTDLLVAPRDGEVLAAAKKGAKPKTTFSWQSDGDTREYRLVLRRASAPDGKPALSKTTTEQSVELELNPGRYLWGVYAVGEPDRPLYLKARKLTVERRKAPKAKTKDLWD